MIIDENLIKNYIKNSENGITYVRAHTRQIRKVEQEQNEQNSNFSPSIFEMRDGNVPYDPDYDYDSSYDRTINYLVDRSKRSVWENTIADFKAIIRRFKFELRKLDCPTENS